jgi:ribonuclease P protein component
MLASNNRLTKKDDIEKVKREGRLFQRKLFGAVVLPKSKKEDSRFAFIVSTKISKHAPQRNRIKRALRESVRHNLYIIGKGYDVVFLPKKEIARTTTDEMMKEVKLFISDNLDKK